MESESRGGRRGGGWEGRVAEGERKKDMRSVSWG